MSATKKPFLLIAGPCAIEDSETPLVVAQTVSSICKKLGISYIFKSSYRKANRTRIDSFTGLGTDAGLQILHDVKTRFGVEVITDVHETHEVNEAASVADHLQIPAFLCRQTDLLVACGQSGRGVNIKKGQFASADSMRHAVNKVRSTGNHNVMLTERGTTFGYTDLVVDMRNFPIMQSIGLPVIFDATHSLQQPNQNSGVTGGLPHLIGTLSRAAVAAGCDGLFIETHPQPLLAKSDGANMLPLDQLEGLLVSCLNIRAALGA